MHRRAFLALFPALALTRQRRKLAVTMDDVDGFDTIGVEGAYADPVFREPLDVLPAGESLIGSIAHASGKYETRLRYPGEDGEYEKALLDELAL